MESKNKLPITDNELIAQFMGEESRDYHESWDCLMPVVQKIDGIYDYDRSMHEDVVDLPVSTPINEVYKAVIAFIKWYNL